MVITMNKTVLKMIEIYQGGASDKKNFKCRHTPTCSHYAKESFEKFNFFKAFYLSTKRYLSCNPLFKPKYDPVPEKRVKKWLVLLLVNWKKENLLFKE